ncbi:lipocalin-like domain-containing protein [Clostridium manihotivorum]|uniref:Uncharacterized protein n=1 Tax=Clostridium manihotivorum TaxID=2320868 RepID=A0A3R5QWU1_9CLOT|nr:glycoside hydrolase family 43 C-terminal domain-containing protein [Clostridium manihotivorum]QAA34492.1 hypothetical protein C1I91_24220 [Clostridium manihotivorum]
MEDNMVYTLKNIKTLIPNFIGANTIKAANEYRIYETVYTDDETSSSINLFTAKSLEDEFVSRLPIISSNINDKVSAENPHPVLEVETGEHYLFYGDGRDGIYALHLNPRNGLAHIEGFGTCVARRPKWVGEAISEPYVVYNEKTNYYYLFVTYGDKNLDANIRVGRSKKITGPYLDANNRSLTDPYDYKEEIGFMISCGYRFDDSYGRVAVSRPLVFEREDSKWLFLQEAFSNSKEKEKNFEVRELLWTPDGWPVISPEPYKEIQEETLTLEGLIGPYEFIKLTPTLPQGVFNSVSLDILDKEMQGASSTRNSWAVKMPEYAEGRIELGGSIRGAWKLIDFQTIKFTYVNYKETYMIKQAYDDELGKPTIILTGKDTNGVACFAKKCDLPKFEF